MCGVLNKNIYIYVLKACKDISLLKHQRGLGGPFEKTTPPPGGQIMYNDDSLAAPELRNEASTTNFGLLAKLTNASLRSNFCASLFNKEIVHTMFFL